MRPPASLSVAAPAPTPGRRGALLGAAAALLAGSARAAGAAQAVGLPAAPGRDGAAPARGAGGMGVLFLGDSLAQGLYLSMVRSLRGHSGLRLVNATKHATGLTRSDQYDWVAASREAVQKNSPDLVLVWIGANDFRPLVDRERRLRADFGTTAFVEGYLARVEAIAGLGTGNHGGDGPVLAWIGLPNMRDRRFAEAAEQLNQLQEAGARQQGAVWVPSWDLTSDANGEFLVSVAGPDRAEYRLRADDGVHFSDIGYRMMARRTLGVVAAERPEMAGALSVAIGELEA
ncbi:GDSL-type esterase/lipase family protein [Roseomonas sp. NAR14]|uniref:GDSL-type esterase/lipase family protein n=1 Tax=Roseomonas acroporae TaxID=2937791 RepID=A0A9X1Y8J9_9PROT|nr:GDSL-type esterase/lipase family protein [Roseomonas acroporae]MCK8785050.1 GDSL-type esterase/lipase family protein [Roseomonas acroporae]